MLNYLKQSINDFKECCKAASLLGANPVFFLLDEERKSINIQGYEFYYFQSPDITTTMRANAGFLALILSNGKIVVDESFDTLSQATKEFIILHETSHLTLNKMGGKRNIENEIACDLQAFKYLGITDEDLIKEIYKEIIDLRCYFLYKRELKKRQRAVLKEIALTYKEYSVKSLKNI